MMSQPSSAISPILLGSPFSFVSEYAVNILGEKQKFSQVRAIASGYVCYSFVGIVTDWQYTEVAIALLWQFGYVCSLNLFITIIL